MEKESKLFDKKFVHFMWDDELEGKWVFCSSDIQSLQMFVETGADPRRWKEGTPPYFLKKGTEKEPFMVQGLGFFSFAYYDPNYSVKWAYYKEGKKVQVKKIDRFADWTDCDEPLWSKDCSYRIKPEEEKWIAYLSRYQDVLTLCCCDESNWERSKRVAGAKTKLFVGTEEECVEWISAREKFTEVIKAWEDGKTIQVYETLFKRWGDCTGTLEWYTDCEYRVKPDCPCEDGIDSKACAGCPQDEARKQTFRPFKDCDELIEFWIKHYQSTNKPMYTKPLIWVRLKVDKRERIIVAFGTDFVEIGNKVKAVPLQKLFDDYEFLDGCVIGVKVEEFLKEEL